MNHGLTSIFLKSRIPAARVVVSLFVSVLLITASKAQTAGGQPSSPALNSNEELQVNWLYGAYVPKDVPLHPLSNHQRFQLFLRQSFTTPGVYLKTAFFSLSDQAENHPPEWGDGFGGYAKRAASRYGQFVTQSALSAAGNALLGYEPRYDRCRCDGFWPRTGHAILRNFLTYNRTEQQLRPQFAMYAGAFGGGVIGATWLPDHPGLLTKGYQGVITQATFGACANWLGEFAPEIIRVLKRNKTGNTAATN